MLSRDKRLRREKDIAMVYRKGRYGGVSSLQVKALSSKLPTSRVAIVVSKKISKRAVVRNRIKRRLSGYLGDNWQTVQPGYDIVVTVREDVSKTAPTALGQDLNSALRKSGVLTQ